MSFLTRYDGELREPLVWCKTKGLESLSPITHCQSEQGRQPRLRRQEAVSPATQNKPLAEEITQQPLTVFSPS